MSLHLMDSPNRPTAGSCSDCTRRSLRLFCNLSDEALHHFDTIGMQMSLPARATIYREDERSDSVFVVCQGQLKLSTMSREGRVMILKLAGAGDILGLSAVLNDTPHELTAETLEPTLLKSIRKSDFLDFLKTHLEVSEKTSHVMAKEYRDAFLDARRLALSGSATGRLARLLLDWAKTAACGKKELTFTMALTHEELANMTGTSRETVTRLLNHFEREKLILRTGKTLKILAPTKMDALVE